MRRRSARRRNLRDSGLGRKVATGMSHRLGTGAAKPFISSLVALSLLPAAAVASPSSASASTASMTLAVRSAAAGPSWSPWSPLPTEYLTREQAVGAMRQAYKWVGDGLSVNRLELRVRDIWRNAATGLALGFHLEWRQRLT